MNDKEFEKFGEMVLDGIGQLFIEKCVDNVYDKIDKYKKEDKIFKVFFESLDKEQLDNYNKIAYRQFVYEYNAGILDIFDHHTEFSLKYIENNKEYDFNWDFSDALVGELVAEEFGWIDRFSKKIKIIKIWG